MGFFALSELQNPILEVLSHFHVRTFLPQGFNFERNRTAWGCHKPSHFAYPFLSLQPQNWYQHCGLPLLVYFAFAITLLAEKAKRNRTLKLCLYS